MREEIKVSHSKIQYFIITNMIPPKYCKEKNCRDPKVPDLKHRRIPVFS